MKFFVEARWDEEAAVFVADSNIVGLHIEAKTIEAFEETMMELAPELILANHVSPADMAQRPIKAWMPSWVWRGVAASAAQV